MKFTFEVKNTDSRHKSVKEQFVASKQQASLLKTEVSDSDIRNLGLGVSLLCLVSVTGNLKINFVF